MNPTSLAYYIGLAIINFLAFVLNFLILVMFIVHRRTLMHDNHNNNRILLAMSVANLLVGLTGTVAWILVGTDSYIWIYRTVGIIPMFSSIFATLIILCLLTFNQLVAVVYPLRYNAIITNGRVTASIISAFVFAALFCINESVVYFLKDAKFELQVRSVFLVAAFILGVLILTASNYKLYRAIQYQRRRLAPLMTISTRSISAACNRPLADYNIQRVALGFKSARLMKRRLDLKRGTMCVWLVVVFVFTWMPIACYYFSRFCGRTTAIKPLLRVSMTLATSNSILNPCLYLLHKKTFRSTLMQMLLRKSDT
eukprot:gene9752-10749_t